jgi:hypothetical protein
MSCEFNVTVGGLLAGLPKTVEDVYGLGTGGEVGGPEIAVVVPYITRMART